MRLDQQRVLVLGLGDTGLSMVRWLLRAGAVVRVADTRSNAPHAALLRKEFPQVQLHLGPFEEKIFGDIDILATSPGIDLREPTIAKTIGRGIPIIGDIELFAQAIKQSGPTKVVAITGSNGKTTVTSMVGAMLRSAGLSTEVAGNIGPPVLDALLRCTQANQLPQAWVLELSSFQLETTNSLAIDAGVVLNISEDHLDRYASMEDYAAAKARLYAQCAVQVVNRDDSRVMNMMLADKPCLSFGLDKPRSEAEFGLLQDDSHIYLARGAQSLIPTEALRVNGLHNAANALAALALCAALALPEQPLLQALREFKGLAHRVEKVTEISGVTFYDDSKGTNVGATVAALNGMSSKVVLIAGGDGKGQDFSPLKNAVSVHARGVVLIGHDRERIAEAIAASGVPIERANDMQEAVKRAFGMAQKGDFVLLSPACASFDMFRNYQHRAEVFIEAVHNLVATV